MNGTTQHVRRSRTNAVWALAAVMTVAILMPNTAYSSGDSLNHWVRYDTSGPFRTLAGYAFDLSRDRFVVFAGEDTTSAFSTETWEWDSLGWELADSTGPAARVNMGMTYDEENAQTVLFGGWTRPDSYFDDTWVWDGTDWVQMQRPGPSARANVAMAYDSRRHRVVMFGGSYYQTIYAETWEWDGDSWRQRNVSGPSARIFPQMTYDKRREKCVLFGGQSSYAGIRLHDTWEWDGDTWVLVDTSGPAARVNHMMAYDSTRGQTVLYGGTDQFYWEEIFNDTWEWDGEEWVMITDSAPGRRCMGGMAYDDRLRRIVMYGGSSSSSILNDLWIYSGSDPNMQVGVPDSMSGVVGDTVLIPILVSGQEDDSVFSADITLRFGESVLTATGGYDSGDVAHGWSIDTHAFPDSLVIAMGGADPLGAGDTLLYVKMLVDSADTTTVWFERCLLNEGNVSCTTQAGIFYGAPRTKSISGTLEYYRGTEEGIPDVRLVMSGDVDDTTYTDSSGYYASTVVAGYDVTVSPERSSESREPAVSSYDAALVLRHAVHKDTLDSLQCIAGDVSGRGGVTAFDASLILRYAVGIVSHFQVGDWTFRPPQRVYEPLSENQVDQDYAGILYGDPSGNWSGLDALAAWEGVAAVASRSCFALNLPESECSNALSPAVTETSSPSSAQAIVFPIVAHDVRGLISADAVVRYDAEWYVLRGIRTTAQTEGYMVAANDRGGYVRIAMAGTKKLNGDVRLLELVFEPAAQASAQSSVSSPIAEVVWLMPNEGAAEPTEPAREGAVGSERTLPVTFYLGLPRPNPFGDGTSITYGLPFASGVELSLFDVAGNKVRTLADGTQSAGRYSLTWDGHDAKGQRLANGLYFVRMKTPTSQFEGKVTLLRDGR